MKFDMEKALGLPTGSVRAIMAIGIGVLIGIMYLKGTGAPEWLCGIFISVISYYFGFKNGNGKK